jgi:hypothetical protein
MRDETTRREKRRQKNEIKKLETEAKTKAGSHRRKK